MQNVPRSLKAIAQRDEAAAILVVGSSDYIGAMEEDLMAAAGVLRDSRRLDRGLHACKRNAKQIAAAFGAIFRSALQQASAAPVRRSTRELPGRSFLKPSDGNSGPTS